MKVSIRKETTLWNTFQDFLRNGGKKTQLCIIIADAISQVCCQKTIIATAQEEEMSNSVDRNCKDIMPRNLEEAATRLLCYVFNASKLG